MEFLLYLFLFLLIGVLLLLPYLSVWRYHARYRKELKKLCRIRHYRLLLKKSERMIVGSEHEVPDFLIDTGKTIYAVRCFSGVYRGAILLLGVDGTITVQRRISHPLHRRLGESGHSVKEQAHRVFAPRIPQRFSSRAQSRRVFLMLPPPTSAFLRKNGENYPILGGETFCGMEVFTPELLLKLLQD